MSNYELAGYIARELETMRTAMLWPVEEVEGSKLPASDLAALAASRAVNALHRMEERGLSCDQCGGTGARLQRFHNAQGLLMQFCPQCAEEAYKAGMIL